MQSLCRAPSGRDSSPLPEAGNKRAIHKSMSLNEVTRKRDQDARRVSLAIDRDLEREAKAMKAGGTSTRVLILGPAASGKTTFVKQLKLIHGSGFTQLDKERFRSIIWYNIWFGCMAVISNLEQLQERFSHNPELVTLMKTTAKDLEKEWKHASLPSQQKVQSLPEQVQQLLKALHQDGTLKTLIKERYRLDCGESFEFFFLQRLNQVLSSDWFPDEDDILNARAVTRAVTEYDFTINGIKQVFIDVSGQKSQRMKWIHQFEGTSSVLFFAPIGNYNQNLAENPEINSMADCLSLFDSLVNQVVLQKTTFVLFLNKVDLFDDKIARIPLKTYMPSYSGGETVKEARSFVMKSFMNLVNSNREKPYVHFTSATDRNAMKFIVTAVMDSIQKKFLSAAGVL